MASSSNGGDPGRPDPALTLLSEERLDGRSSPELWPEPIPGVTEFAGLFSPQHSRKSIPKWNLDEDGLVMLQELGSLTASALLEKVKDLQNLAYKLGVEEAREMTRGRMLDILRKDKEPKKSERSGVGGSFGGKRPPPPPPQRREKE